MEIFSWRILTIVNILYFLRVLAIAFAVGIPLTFALYFKHNSSLQLAFSGLGIIFLFSIKNIFSYVKKMIISRAKHPLPLNLLCNMNELGKSYYFGKDTFDLDEIIYDNQLPLTLYYINNSQYPILQFNKDSLLFHNREYYWKNLNWKYFLEKTPESTKPGKYIIQFEGTDQDNNRIKNKIEFEKVKAEENEVILLFVIHDLLFGKKSSFYY